MLESIFGSRTRVKLLKIFLTQPDGYFFVRELARRTDERINSIRRELNNLEEFGIVIGEDKIKFDLTKDKKEKRKYYKANTDFVLYEEFRNLILKSRLLLEKSLAKDISSVGSVKLLVLSGIFVGDNKSKTDLFIVGKINKTKLETLISKIEKDFDSDIRYTSMNEEEFKYRNQVTDKFLFEVLEGKKIVVIDEVK